MSIQLIKWKIFCITDNKDEYIWQEHPPTVCPVNTNHSINLESITNEGTSGIITITNIDNSNISNSANININKLADGTITNNEFQYLDGVTSNIQDQIDSKTNINHTHNLSNISDFNELHYVHVTGTETITGKKTFNNKVFIDGVGNNLTIGTSNTSTNNNAKLFMVPESDLDWIKVKTDANASFILYENGAPHIKLSDVDDPASIILQQIGSGSENMPEFKTEITLSDKLNSDLLIKINNENKLTINTNGLLNVETDNYEKLVTETNNIPNKKFVDESLFNHSQLTSCHGVNGNIVGTQNEQSLTNKIIDSTTNTITADKLHSATTTISISDSIAPITGQVLTAINSTSANWQTPGAIFGSQFHKVSSFEEFSTTDTDFQQKIRLTTPELPEGIYRIGWSFKIKNDGNLGGKYQIQINDTDTICENSGINSNMPIFIKDTGFFYTEKISGKQNIDIDYAAIDGITYIKETILEIWRIS